MAEGEKEQGLEIEERSRKEGGGKEWLRQREGKKA